MPFPTATLTQAQADNVTLDAFELAGIEINEWYGARSTGYFIEQSAKVLRLSASS